MTFQWFSKPSQISLSLFRAKRLSPMLLARPADLNRLITTLGVLFDTVALDGFLISRLIWTFSSETRIAHVRQITNSSRSLGDFGVR